ncbi:anhydro-N-acetylmuramic acid kinase [Granulicella rosea]|uniref:Anhydro-N-acetylmuramic acid kinase n=1 Tax=Granulicella rosea TaxID=474952 RepID=A0A239J240_9BACT|nr:anhydro-N-acetylmuramic acid kinase [Granulicella rosea]SNS99880.1 anhydro-N-acetylmuramic acid kinase [Granulicella rosea]
MKLKSLVVAGVMSGTSADGVDVALVRISPPKKVGGTPKLALLTHRQFPYDAAIREAVLRAMDAKSISAADLARLNWRLGEVYADCVADTVAASGIQPDLIGCHGQTIYHQATAQEFCGAPVRTTWQIGEASVIAERLRIPVVSDLRPADLAAGGQGAPLVPMLDYTLFRSRKSHRILLNLGGIANVTAIPAGAGIDRILAFDTGPANMVIDAVMHRLYGRAYDCGGQTAARGEPLSIALDHPFFAAAPPKSCGREEFGAAFVDDFIVRLQARGAKKADIVAAATTLTATSIADACARFCRPHLGDGPIEMIATGGGTQNSFLLKQLRLLLEKQGVKMLLSDEIGLPSEAKEAVAFALLAWLSWHRLPGNIPSATGAGRPVILGKITHA